jgi:hypothetical protein
VESPRRWPGTQLQASAWPWRHALIYRHRHGRGGMLPIPPHPWSPLLIRASPSPSSFLPFLSLLFFSSTSPLFIARSALSSPSRTNDFHSCWSRLRWVMPVWVPPFFFFCLCGLLCAEPVEVISVCPSKLFRFCSSFLQLQVPLMIGCSSRISSILLPVRYVVSLLIWFSSQWLDSNLKL